MYMNEPHQYGLVKETEVIKNFEAVKEFRPGPEQKLST